MSRPARTPLGTITMPCNGCFKPHREQYSVGEGLRGYCDPCFEVISARVRDRDIISKGIRKANGKEHLKKYNSSSRRYGTRFRDPYMAQVYKLGRTGRVQRKSEGH